MLFVQQLGNVSNSRLQNRAFVLVRPRDDLGKLVDAFIDGLAAASLNCSRVSRVGRSTRNLF
jgi:hypothetical protein